MPISTVVRVKRDGQIAIIDAAAAHTFTFIYEPGNFTYSGGAESFSVFKSRGKLGTIPSVRINEEMELKGSFTFWQTDLGDTANGYVTPQDILNPYTGRYAATNWASTLGQNSDLRTFTLSLSIDGTPFGEADKTLTFNYVRFDPPSFKEGDPNEVTVSWTSFTKVPVLS